MYADNSCRSLEFYREAGEEVTMQHPTTLVFVSLPASFLSMKNYLPRNTQDGKVEPASTNKKRPQT